MPGFCWCWWMWNCGQVLRKISFYKTPTKPLKSVCSGWGSWALCGRQLFSACRQRQPLANRIAAHGSSPLLSEQDTESYLELFQLSLGRVLILWWRHSKTKTRGYRLKTNHHHNQKPNKQMKNPLGFSSFLLKIIFWEGSLLLFVFRACDFMKSTQLHFP